MEKDYDRETMNIFSHYRKWNKQKQQQKTNKLGLVKVPGFCGRTIAGYKGVIEDSDFWMFTSSFSKIRLVNSTIAYLQELKKKKQKNIICLEN